MIRREGSEVVWRFTPRQAREFADDIELAWPYPDRACEDAAALRAAADRADPPPDPDAPFIRIVIERDMAWGDDTEPVPPPTEPRVPTMDLIDERRHW